MAVKVVPYLHYGGQCEEAFIHYKKVLGGEFTSLNRYKDWPGKEIPEEVKEKVMHMSLKVHDGLDLYGDDHIQPFSEPPAQGDSVQVFLQYDDLAQAEQAFAGLSEGGTVKQALAKQFWGATAGELIDAWGIPWYLCVSGAKCAAEAKACAAGAAKGCGCGGDKGCGCEGAA